MGVLGWRCWFAGGLVVDSGGADLPSDGCLGIVVFYEERVTPGGPRYRDNVTGDWYVVRAGGQLEAFGHRQDGT
jgi:hypothetical protein